MTDNTDQQKQASKQAEAEARAMAEEQARADATAEILATLGGDDSEIDPDFAEMDDAEAEFAAGESEQPQSPLEALARENDQLESEAKDLKDQMLRMAADMENLRRRTQKDVADAKSFSIASFARDMLSVTDNLRRAIDAVPADELQNDEGGLKNLLEGVQLTEREMLNALQKNGVKEITPKGEKFDPNYHQAMFEVQNPDVPNNSVMEVVQSGYVIGERMLRPAMVGVAKGGPKMVQPKADDAE